MNKSCKKILLFLVILLFIPLKIFPWGYYVHPVINRMAVFTLPPEMIGFYKTHIDYISKRAVNPDKRKYVIKGEKPRHYIDVEHYGKQPFDVIPIHWQDAVYKYTEDTLNACGILPWNIQLVIYQLTEAFKEKNTDKILALSTDIGHYIGDACTPLHTTMYYDGKTKAQKGIHGLMDTRLPQMFADKYNYLVGSARYIDFQAETIWELIKNSHNAVDTIFITDSILRNEFSENKKYLYNNKGQKVSRFNSDEYCTAFNSHLNGIVERQIRTAIQTTGSIWYTCWVNAGKPDLTQLN